MAERKNEAIIIRWAKDERGKSRLKFDSLLLSTFSCRASPSPLVLSLSPSAEAEEEDRRMQFPRAPKYVDVFDRPNELFFPKKLCRSPFLLSRDRDIILG